VVNGVYAALPMLRTTPGSAIVNTGSASGFYGSAGLVVYSATKFAVRAITEGLDIELAQLNAAMDAAGRRVPVWASEFSRDTSDQPLAAGELVKQATMLVEPIFKP
jgi:NADP-dependent 3-hydroxy acid dehydrogenase YdfG